MSLQIEVLPNLDLRASRILRRVVAWEAQYRRECASAGAGRPPRPPTTDKVARHFGLEQAAALKILNRLAADGLLTKTRRLSGGARGHGYDGSLFSAVRPTDKGLSLVASHPWGDPGPLGSPG